MPKIPKNAEFEMSTSGNFRAKPVPLKILCVDHPPIIATMSPSRNAELRLEITLAMANPETSPPGLTGAAYPDLPDSRIRVPGSTEIYWLRAIN